MKSIYIVYAAVAWFGALVLFTIVYVALHLRKGGAGSRGNPNSNDWRIPIVPYKDSSNIGVNRRARVQFGFLRVVPGLGMITFVAGCFICLSNNRKIIEGLALALMGWIGCFIGVWLKVRKYRQGWEVACAHCVDHEVKYVLSSTGGDIVLDGLGLVGLFVNMNMQVCGIV
jgi:hypothetical protein